MKVAPVYAELERRGRVDQRLVHTGQHYDSLLNDVFFAELPLPRPHVELSSGSGSHAELERVFRELEPGEPLPYRRFLSLEAEAAAVVTDSGGIQEETTVLDVPCFALRENTERPETLEGTNTLLGLDPVALRSIPALLEQPKRGDVPPLWDGRAGERAADAVERLLAPVEVTA